MWLLFALVYVIYLVVVVPLAALAGAVAYAVGIPGIYFAALARVLIIRPRWLPAPRHWPRPPPDADPAVLEYFYGPAVADAEHAVQVAYAGCRGFLSSGADAVVSSFDTEAPLLSGPLGVGGAIGIVAGAAAGTVAATGCALIQLGVVGLSTAVMRTIGMTLRGVDSALLRVKNIRMICPVCSERVTYPGYVCPGPACTRRHRDVRPGRFGIFRRRCQCDNTMPTLLLFGSSRMDAFCPDHGHPMEHRPGEAPEIVLPFFGATGAGKTRLLYSMVAQLRAWDEAGLVKAEFADSDTARELRAAESILRSGGSTSLTPVKLPRAHVIRLTSGGAARILHMFDAAGERFYHSERTQELRYLGKARTLLLVIDPLSVDSLWAHLPAARQAELAPVRSAAPSPDLAYQQTHQEIEAMGVHLRQVRLAVVFSRADLVAAPEGEVAAWACHELGLGNLIRSARLNFKETRFFLTAAGLRDGVIDESVVTLMHWILADSGVALPGGKP
jgi:ABC-type phosphonate transport system ATPase subunit